MFVIPEDPAPGYCDPATPIMEPPALAQGVDAATVLTRRGLFPGPLRSEDVQARVTDSAGGCNRL